jgi:hypothetical protein
VGSWTESGKVSAVNVLVVNVILDDVCDTSLNCVTEIEIEIDFGFYFDFVNFSRADRLENAVCENGVCS